jgi:hypothetical protein
MAKLYSGFESRITVAAGNASRIPLSQARLVTNPPSTWNSSTPHVLHE